MSNTTTAQEVEPRRSAGDAKLQLVAKAVDVLNSIATHGDLTTTELADRMGEPRSSMYRLVGSLVDLDLIEPGARRGTYRLGVGLLRLGATVAERLDVRRYSLPFMQDLHESTGLTVFLCVRRGLEAVCVERLDGLLVQSLALRLGGSLPLHLGAAPQALLAFEPDDAWTDYVEAVRTPDVRADALFPVLEQVRTNGIAVSDGDVTPGIAALAVAVRDHRGLVAGALSVSGVRPVVLEDGRGDLEGALRAAGDAVSSALGFGRTDVQWPARMRPS